MERNELSIIISATGNKLSTCATTTPLNPYILNSIPNILLIYSVTTPRLPNKILNDNEKINGGATIGKSDNTRYTLDIALVVRVTYNAKRTLIQMTIVVVIIPTPILFNSDTK